MQGLATLLLGVLLINPLQLLAAGTTTPYNSPIRNANPNSRQGSVSPMPPVRGPSTVPIVRQPTVENRGVGNGDNLRREQSTPPSNTPRSQHQTDDRTQ
ncbi:hypothetical protein [Pseudomonas akapageensis]|uniref:hypothetical protein n=1 Tax=Pseudomonas akapageensis TaxID=2609961 RepID=UPI001C49985A